jgi:hypothetical protein
MKMRGKSAVTIERRSEEGDALASTLTERRYKRCMCLKPMAATFPVHF